MDNILATRLEKLESSLAHMERVYEELNKVVIEQGRVLSRMQSQQKQVSESLQSIELERIHSTNPKPPHYG